MADFRRDYRAGDLSRADLGGDPLAQFQRWFDHAAAAHSGGRWRKIGIALYKLWQALLGHAPADVNAMILATVARTAAPPPARSCSRARTRADSFSSRTTTAAKVRN